MSASFLAERILGRASRAHLSIEPDRLGRLEEYYNLLARWNRTINLTALPLDDYSDAALDRLIIEPLFAASRVADSPLACVDFGSGGGSPAIPLKIARPQMTMTMVESRERKAAFLRAAVSNLALPATTVLVGRFEELVPQMSGTADLVTVRAVRTDGLMLESAAGVLKQGGRLMMFHSADSVRPESELLTFLEDVELTPLRARLCTMEKR